MGLQTQGAQGNFKYYTVRDGQIHHTEVQEDGSKKDYAGYSYSGELTGIRIVTRQFEGNETQKVELRVKDTSPNSDEVALLQFGLQSWYCINLFRRFANVNDWSGTFEFGCSGGKEGGNKKVTFAWLKHNGKTVEQNKDAVPEPETHIISKKPTKDWTPVIDVVTPMVEKISGELKKLGHEPYTGKPVAQDTEVKQREDVEAW